MDRRSYDRAKEWSDERVWMCVLSVVGKKDCAAARAHSEGRCVRVLPGAALHKVLI